jgi:hypothetical protein
LVAPQNDAAHVQHVVPHALLAPDLGHLKRSILSRRDLVLSGSVLGRWSLANDLVTYSSPTPVLGLWLYLTPCGSG